MAIQDGNILFFDGACGTNLQRMEIPASAWEGRGSGIIRSGVRPAARMISSGT